MRLRLIGTIFLASQVGCRSGHFENKNLLDSTLNFQVTHVATENLGSCNGQSQDCQKLSVSLKLVGPNEEPLRNHRLELTVVHPDLLSEPKTQITSDASGILKFTLDFKLKPDTAPSIIQVLIGFKSAVLGSHQYLASINIRNLSTPVIEWKSAAPDAKPSTQAITETLIATPMSLIARQTEKSPHVFEFNLEHRVTFATQSEPHLKQRKIFYQISFSNSTLEGALITDSQGEGIISFPVLFRPYEPEANLEIKMTARLSEDLQEKATEWRLVVNFDRDPVAPLVTPGSSGAEANAAVTSGTQHLGISHLHVEDLPSAETYEVNEAGDLTFSPQYQLELIIDLSRRRLGRTEPERKRLVRTMLRGKIFIFNLESSQNSQIIFEQSFENISNELGEVTLNVKPGGLRIPLSALTTRWVLALELPEFPKIEKTFFLLDPRSAQPTPWTKAQALSALGNRIYDLTVSRSPSVKSPVGSRASPDEAIGQLYPKALLLQNLPQDFETRLGRASESTDLNAWRSVFDLVDSKAGIGLTTKSEVYQIDMIQNFEPAEALDKKTFSTSIRDDSHAELHVQVRQYLFSVHGKTRRCFVFRGSEDRYFCLQNSLKFETMDALSVLSSPPDEFAFSPVVVHGPVDFSLPFSEIRKASQPALQTLRVKKIFGTP